MNFDDEKEKSLAEFLTIFHTALRKYWRIAVGPALVVLALSVIAGIRLKDFYKADFLVYIQPKRFNSEILGKQDKDEMSEQMEALFQEILSRTKLGTIREQFSLYPEYTGPVGKEAAIKKFRSAVNIGPAKSATGKIISQTFRVQYTNNDPKKAFEVARKISDLFVDNSRRSKFRQVGGKKEFFNAELLEAKKKLERIEEEERKFISENTKRLPQNLNAVIARLESAQNLLTSNSQNLAALKERKSNLQREVGDLNKAGPVGGGALVANSSDPQEQLANLERALTVLLSRYSPKHPDVINTKKRIRLLKAQIKAGGGKVRSGRSSLSALSLPARQVQRQVDDAQVQITRLEAENDNLKDKINQLELDIQEMPNNEVRLKKIQRDKANLESHYNSLLGESQRVGVQENLIATGKDTQFKIVEAAELPNIPAGPNRAIVWGLGLIGSLATFALLPFLLSLLNSSYKFTGEVENELDIEVIGVIPPMVTPHSVVDSRRVYALCSILSLLVFTGGTLALFILV